MNKLRNTLSDLKNGRIYNFVYALAEQGCRGEAPARKNDVILRSARRPLGDEGSRGAPIYKRAAVPVRRGLN